jgi:hypothetical protein
VSCGQCSFTIQATNKRSCACAGCPSGTQCDMSAGQCLDAAAASPSPSSPSAAGGEEQVSLSSPADSAPSLPSTPALAYEPQFPGIATSGSGSLVDSSTEALSSLSASASPGTVSSTSPPSPPPHMFPGASTSTPALITSDLGSGGGEPAVLNSFSSTADSALAETGLAQSAGVHVGADVSASDLAAFLNTYSHSGTLGATRSGGGLSRGPPVGEAGSFPGRR